MCPLSVEPATLTSRFTRICGGPNESVSSPIYQEPLAAVGLTGKRQDETLGGLLQVFDNRNDVKPATKLSWGQARRNLFEFFSENTPLRGVTPATAEDFHQYLVGLGLASWTIHKRLQVCRTFFRTAIRRGLIQANPFGEVVHQKGSTAERQWFVSREVMAKLMAGCNLNRRVILALSRFGGLRCPSEVLSLRWADVDWKTSRLTVRSPKTEHHKGKDRRVVPIFPELRPILEEAYKLAQEEGNKYVVSGNYRQAAMGVNGGPKGQRLAEVCVGL
jgi:integrase